MTTFLRFFTTITLLLLIAPLAFGQVAEKTLVKSFAVDKNQTVSIDVPGPVEVKSWSNTTIRVQMTITLQNGNEAILKSLISAGRYNLVAKEEAGVVIIHAPALEKEVQIGGEPLKDAISIIVFAPDSVTIKNAQNTHNTSVGSSF